MFFCKELNIVIKYTCINNPEELNEEFEKYMKIVEIIKKLDKEYSNIFYTSLELKKYENGYREIMEYAGNSLIKIYNNKEKDNNSWIEVLLQFPELIKILDELHKMKIFIRDLKPDNICYNPSTKKMVIIDVEFLIKTDPDTVSICGTPSYISPFDIKAIQKRRPINLVLFD